MVIINWKNGVMANLDEKVVYNTEDRIKIDEDRISKLKSIAAKNESKNVTMCLHRTHDVAVHEMINVYPKGMYVRPHKHLDKTETKHMIEGKMLMLMFDEEGGVTDKFVIGEKGSGECLAYRIDKNLYHSIIPLSETIVYHEIISGPYTGTNDSIFPEWAPEIDDQKGIQEFIDRVGK